MKQFINTIDANFKYYDIDLANIWEYEREKFLLGATDLSLAQKIIDLTQRLIVKNGKPSFGEEMIEIDSKYYGRNVIDYHQADLKMKYALNYFIHKNDCYEYSQSIHLLRNDEDFSFFFSLKLSQYNGKIEETERFLQNHLLITFNEDVKDYRKFLKRLVLQFPAFFQPSLKAEIEEFISSCESQQFKGRQENLNPDKFLTDKNIKKVKDNNIAIDVSKGNEELIKIWVGTNAQLEKLYKFVNGILIKSIDKEEFKKHFSGSAYLERIDWIVELNIFIELFDRLASNKKINPVMVKRNNQLTEECKSVVIISKFISHFNFKGVSKPSPVLNNVRSQFYQSKNIESRFHNEILEFIEKLNNKVID